MTCFWMEEKGIVECHYLMRTLRKCSLHIESQAFLYMHFLHLGQEGWADWMKYLVNGRRSWIRLPRVSAPVHGIDFSQMPPQCPSSAHLNSANGVNVSCDLNDIKIKQRFVKSVNLKQILAFLLHTLSEWQIKVTILTFLTWDRVASAHAFLASWNTIINNLF